MKRNLLIIMCFLISNLAISMEKSKEPAAEKEVTEAGVKTEKVSECDLESLDTAEALETCLTSSSEALIKLQDALLESHKEDKDSLALLKTMQDSWMAYRDAQCEFVGKNTASGGAEKIILRCEVQHTMARVESLKSL